MDQRLVAIGTGAVMGLVLVVGLAFVRPPSTGLHGAVPLPVETLAPPMPAEELVALFGRTGRATAFEGEPVRLASGPAGRLRLPSGRLVIADAFYLGIDNAVMSLALPAGEHDVMVLTARGESLDMPAAALVTVGGSVREWRAIPEASYAGAETGVVAIAPVELNERLARDEAAAEAVVDRLVETIEASIGDDAPPWHEVEAIDGLRLYAVTSELGLRTAYWGLDGDGDPVALLLDFGILDHEGDG